MCNGHSNGVRGMLARSTHEVLAMIPLPIVVEQSGGWGRASGELPGRTETGGSLTLDPSHPSLGGPALVAQLLDEQQSLSAVDHFSQWHRACRGEVPSTEYAVQTTDATLSLAPARDAAWAGATICLRSRPRPLLRLQGVRRRVPHAQRAGRKRNVARRRVCWSAARAPRR